jgi:hypothetical protein
MTKTNPHFLTDVNADWHVRLVSDGGRGDAAADDDVDDDESQKESVIA